MDANVLQIAGAIVATAVGVVVAVVGYLLKRSISENDRRQEMSREEANRRLDVIQTDLKALVAAYGEAKGDHRVLEERFRKCEADTRVLDERARKAEEEVSLLRNRFHDLGSKVQVLMVRFERNGKPPDGAPA